MRKLLIIIFFCFVFSVNIKSKSNYKYLENDDSYNIYSVSIENLNTKNFHTFFSGVDVVRIYPSVNPIYKNKIGEVSYRFRSSNIDKEINVFRQNYLEFIKKNSYKDYNYLYVNGIDISKVDIYISGSKLYKLLTLYEELIRFVK